MSLTITTPGPSTPEGNSLAGAGLQCWRDENADVWCQAGFALGIHPTETVVYQLSGAAGVGIVPRGSVARGEVEQLAPPAGQILLGGSGRNWRISGGPSDPLFPRGVYRPVSPNVWATPEFPEASFTLDPGTGTLSLHDGTAEVASGAAFANGSGTASAGTMTDQDYAYASTAGGGEMYFAGVTDPSFTVVFNPATGSSAIDGPSGTVAVRAGVDTTGFAGTYVATTLGEDDYNSGSPFDYTITGGVGAATLTATSHGEDEYNGGGAFDFEAEFEGSIAGRAVAISVDAGTAQAGVFNWTGWQEFVSADDAAWKVTIDGAGEATFWHGSDAVAVRAADASKLYDPSGNYVATPTGAGLFGGAVNVTSGEASAGTVPGQAFAVLGTVGAVETWNGVTSPVFYVELGTGSGDAVLFDGYGAVAERLGGSTTVIDGSFVATEYGKATYNGGGAFTFDIATGAEATGFSVTATRLPAVTRAGWAYAVLTVDGSDLLTGVSGPFWAASLPGNSSTEKVYPIAFSSGSGLPVQIKTGPIEWRP